MLAARFSLQRLLPPLLACMILWSSSASADAPESSARAEARRLFLVGVAAAKDGAWEAARNHFSESYALVPNAVTLLNLAGAQLKTGQLLEARQSYLNVLGAGDQVAAYQPEVERVLADLSARVPVIQFEGAKLADSDRLILDGQTVSATGEPIPVNPGSHTLEIRREASWLVQKDVSVSEGQHLTLKLDLLCPPCSEAPAQADLPTPPRNTRVTSSPEPVTKESSSFEKPLPPRRIVPWVALGVAGAGAILAGVAGSLAVAKRTALIRGCARSRSCSQADVDRVHKLAIATDVGIVTAIVGAAVSGLSFWLGRDDVRVDAHAGPQVLRLTTQVRF